MYDLLIKNANIVTSNNISFGNVAVSNGKIKDVFFDSKTVNAKQILDLNEVEKTLLILKKFNGLAVFHCEDYDIIQKLQKKISQGKLSAKDYLNSRPLEAELIATKNVIAILEKTDSRIHICHVSHPLVAEEIRKAKRKGIKVTGETCTHYLIFTEEDLIHKGMLFKCSPPLRTKEACEGLWEYIIDGTLDCISSDHSPGTIEEKKKIILVPLVHGVD